MTSKERIRAALEHRETDRVPTTMQCVETAWENLRNYLKVESNEEVMQHFEIDTRIMDIPPYIGPQTEPFRNEDGETVYTHPFGSKQILKMPRLIKNEYQHLFGIKYHKIGIGHIQFIHTAY